MKKTITILVALFGVLNLFADSQSGRLLESLQSKVAEFGNYRVEFSVTVDGQSLKGVYEVSGDNYRIVTPDIEVFCDGKVKYEVNKSDKEVMIDNVDPNDRTLLGNPTRMFDFLDGSYSHTLLGKTTLKDGDADRVELTKKGEQGKKGTPGQLNSEKITLYLNMKTALPVRISYYMDNLNTDAVVDIIKITPRITVEKGVFNFNPSRFEDFELIDFR